MKTILLSLILIASAAFTMAGENPSVALRIGESPVSDAEVKQHYKTLTTQLIAEYLETGKVSRESVEAYQLMVGIANRSGVRLERTPLRTADERNLGPALLIARMESLHLGYDSIYHLRLLRP